MAHLEIRKAGAGDESHYARREDFERIFTQHSTDLLRLSLQLTGDARKALTCLSLAMRDCLSASGVLKDRAAAWARRMILRHGVRIAWGTPNDALCNPEVEFALELSEFALEPLRESIAILALPTFDRLAFVICALERYSTGDCAVLLRKASHQVRRAIVRAAERVQAGEEPLAAPSVDRQRANIAKLVAREERFFESSCGSILDHD